MNTLEISELFSSISPSEKYYDEMQEAATMLRQQQAEIEDTKRKWLEACDAIVEIAKRKTLAPLTDDECEAIINRHDWFSKSWREMAKEIHDAILRKAQEK